MVSMARDVLMEFNILIKDPSQKNDRSETTRQKKQWEEERKKRLTAALRENLRKRKEQMRARLKLIDDE